MRSRAPISLIHYLTLRPQGIEVRVTRFEVRMWSGLRPWLDYKPHILLS